MSDIITDTLENRDSKTNDIENSITNSLLIKENPNFSTMYCIYGGICLTGIIIISVYFLLQI
uniref:Uncharacterized protein n=1 Tax=viral metagenome TaxID=1070528 RepID=A0A6C0E2R1_9ZZZZ